MDVGAGQTRQTGAGAAEKTLFFLLAAFTSQLSSQLSSEEEFRTNTKF